jgi:YVTN family beta-propeller protein
MRHPARRRPAPPAALALLLLAGAGASADHPDGDAAPATEWVAASDARALRASAWGLSDAKGVLANAARGAADASFVLTGSDPEGDAPSDVVYTPDGSKIVIAHRESRNLVVWDASSLAFLGAVPVSGAAQAVGVTPDGSTAVVANIDNNTVSIVDLTTFTETAVIPVGVNPGLVAISPAGDLAAVGIGFDSQIAVIDIASATVARTIAGVGFGGRLSFSFEGPATSIQYTPFAFVDADRIVNADFGADEVQFVDVRTGAVRRIAVPDAPQGVALSGDRSRVAVAHGGTTRVLTLIDTATEAVVNAFNAPENLWGPVAINQSGTIGVAAVQNAARVVDLTSGAFGPSLNTASINELITTFDGRYAVGVGFRGAVIDMLTGTLAAQVNNAVSAEHGAVSPVAHRAAMCSTTFGDDLVVADVQGAGGSLLAFQRTGPEVEGDRCRTIALTPDGTRAVGVSIFSDNAAVVDTATNSVVGVAPLGERPSAVAITPDGSKAVVGNLDSSFATVIDLATAASTPVNISRRAGAVAISPDGRYAYLGVVADGDGVWRIDLDTNTVAGPKILTGNMGGVGYSFSQNSGMALSGDGSRLAVAGSFDDVVTIVDAATWSFQTNLPSAGFPAVVAFSPDDARLYAANRNNDTVTVFDNTQNPPAFLRTIAVGDSPWHLADDGQGRLWVNNWGDSRVTAYDVATGAPIVNLDLPDRPVGLAYDGASDTLRVAHGQVSTTLGGSVGFAQSQSGTLSVFDASTFQRADFDLGVGPSAMAQSADGAVIAVAAPIGDGLAVLNLSPGCSAADLAEPFGQLNFFDVAAYLTLYNAGDAAADLAAPFGQLNFFDLAAYLASYNAGCP